MLSPEAMDRLRQFGSELDRVAPGALAGCYAVGSLALGDYVPARSNLDVLAVSAAPWPPDRMRAARRAGRHLADRRRVRGRRPARVGYLTWADLAHGPDGAGACYEGRRAVDPAELLNPLTWQIMRSSAVCSQGPEYPELWSGDLRQWAATRLTDHWAPWTTATARRPGALWLRAATSDAVLEATRLVVALRSGRVVSKLEAGLSSGFTRRDTDELLRLGVAEHCKRALRTDAHWEREARMNGRLPGKQVTANWPAQQDERLVGGERKWEATRWTP